MKAIKAVKKDLAAKVQEIFNTIILIFIHLLTLFDNNVLFS